MNLLLITKHESVVPLQDALQSLHRSGTVVSNICFQSGMSASEFDYRLRNLNWCKAPTPNAIVAILEDDLTVVLSAARIAARDGSLLFVLVEQETGEEQSVKIEESVFGVIANAFLLFDCPVKTQPAAVASCLVQLVDNGFFGRYRVVGHGSSQLNIVPIVRRRKPAGVR